MAKETARKYVLRDGCSMSITVPFEREDGVVTGRSEMRNGGDEVELLPHQAAAFKDKILTPKAYKALKAAAAAEAEAAEEATAASSANANEGKSKAASSSSDSGSSGDSGKGS